MSKQKDVLITDDQKRRFEIAQAKFYSLLKAQGFEDIEDTISSDRPLKTWHNSKFASDEAQVKMNIRKEYQKLIDDFTNGEDFEDICLLMAGHGNCDLTVDDLKEIWDMHSQQALTERKIASLKNRSKTCIHSILDRFRKWMALL